MAQYCHTANKNNVRTANFWQYILCSTCVAEHPRTHGGLVEADLDMFFVCTNHYQSIKHSSFKSWFERHTTDTRKRWTVSGSILCSFRQFIFQFPVLCFSVSVISPFCKSLSTPAGMFVLILKEGGISTREKWNQCSALVDGRKNAVGSCGSSRVQVVSRSLPTGLQVAQGQPGHPSPPKPAAPRSFRSVVSQPTGWCVEV